MRPSSSVYGDSPELPKREGREGRPLSPYAWSKLMTEELAVAFHQAYGLEFVGLRYFNVYGPRQSPEGPYAAVIPRFFSAMLSGEQPVIFGDGEQSRDFTAVGDAVRANLLSATAPDASGRFVQRRRWASGDGQPARPSGREDIGRESQSTSRASPRWRCPAFACRSRGGTGLCRLSPREESRRRSRRLPSILRLAVRLVLQMAPHVPAPAAPATVSASRHAERLESTPGHATIRRWPTVTEPRQPARGRVA